MSRPYTEDGSTFAVKTTAKGATGANGDGHSLAEPKPRSRLDSRAVDAGADGADEFISLQGERSNGSLPSFAGREHGTGSGSNNLINVTISAKSSSNKMSQLHASTMSNEGIHHKYNYANHNNKNNDNINHASNNNHSSDQKSSSSKSNQAQRRAVAGCGSKSRMTYDYFGRNLAIGCFAMAIFAICTSSTDSNHYIFASASKSTPTTSATTTYGDPIKWSFGGWAPLDGSLPKNASHLQQMMRERQGEPNRQQIMQKPTSPMPSPTPRPSQLPIQQQAGNQSRSFEGRPMIPMSREAMSEAASHAKAQFAPVLISQQSHQHQNNLPPPQAGNIQFAAGQHQRPPAGGQPNGPAYSMPSVQFSPPAPAPIVREHVIPGRHFNERDTVVSSYNSFHQQQPGMSRNLMPAIPAGARFPHYLGAIPATGGGSSGHSGNQHQLMMVQQQHPSRHQLQQQPGYQQHQQMMAQHHQRQQRMYQQLMQQAHARPNQQQRPAHHNQLPQPQQQQQLYGRPQQVAEGPGNMQAQHQQQQPQQQPQYAQGPAQQQEPEQQTFKVVEGEQPVMFSSHMAQNNEVPTLEVGGIQGNVSELHREPNAQEADGNSYDHSNSNSNSNKATEQSSYELVPPNYPQGGEQGSNNIQEIKQRQQYEQEQKAKLESSKALGEFVEHATAAQKNSQHSPSTYLTIPVAVETDGDKVLTPDDINEIEKHVINVLPNLKTADKIVKMADAHLSLETIKPQILQQQLTSTSAIPSEQPTQGLSVDSAQVSYDDHRQTMKQLEQDLKDSPREYTSMGAASPLPLSSATPNDAPIRQTSEHQPQHEQQPVSPQAGGEQQDVNQQQHENQYFVAAGPAMQEAMDQDQLADYNLIKNDLMNNFRYEPTRANSLTAASGRTTSHMYNGQQGPNRQRMQPQMGSTPPMPYVANNQQQSRQVNGQYGSSIRPETVTQAPPLQAPGYFAADQGLPRQRQQAFGRLSGQRATSPTQYPTTSNTIMGGRKVSEVMRPLIRTTPVPMTSPIHVSNVQPEKLDAIQFIAGKANEKQPMVVDPHQLVNHTPDGGFDFNSGADVVVHKNNGQGENGGEINQEHRKAPQQEVEQPNGDYQGVGNNNKDNNQGAVIEYVALNEESLNNALEGQQQQQHGAHGHRQQAAAYEIAGQPEAVQQIYVNPEEPASRQVGRRPQVQSSNMQRPAYGSSEYPTTRQQQQQYQSTSHTASPAQTTTGNYVMRGMNQPPAAIMHAAWSPSIANEHQKQQMELNGHVAGPEQQQHVDMPATAGYNFFNQLPEQQPQSGTNYEQPQQQQEQQQSSGNHEQEQEHQQKQMDHHHNHNQNHEMEQQKMQEPSGSMQQADAKRRWRTKAGGSQPNPDAQYDGQIAKGESGDNDNDHDNEHDDNDQQHEQQRHVSEPEDQNNPHHVQQQPAAIERENQQYTTAIGGYGNQKQQSEQQLPVELNRVTQSHESRPQEENHEHEQQHNNNNDNGNESGYPQYHQLQQEQKPTTTSGQYRQQQASDNYLPSTGLYKQQSPSNGNYEQQTTPNQQFNYMKLDRDRQQAHLSQHQAQHQAHMAEMLGSTAGQQQSSAYNNQEIVQTTTPMSQITAEQQNEQQQHVQVNGDNQGSGYMVEEIPSRPSVQSVPESSQQQMPILEQSSLIHDPDQDTNDEFSDDDGAKHHGQASKHAQPVAVYQVYQAYYAPKDHKPLPGYVRLSLDEFHELFRDAEIQYVDKNNNNQLNSGLIGQNQQAAATSSAADAMDRYELQQAGGDMMKASASEQQSIVVDRRSLSNERRLFQVVTNSSNPLGSSSQPEAASKTSAESSHLKSTKFGSQAIKKIISIRSSNKQLANSKQQAKLLKSTTMNTTTGGNSTTKKLATTPKPITIKSLGITGAKAVPISEPVVKPSQKEKRNNKDGPTKKQIGKLQVNKVESLAASTLTTVAHTSAGTDKKTTKSA